VNKDLSVQQVLQVPKVLLALLVSLVPLVNQSPLGLNMSVINYVLGATIIYSKHNEAAIIPYHPDNSLLVQKQSTGNHPGHININKIDQVIAFIKAGTPEKRMRTIYEKILQPHR
jgi:hypothetical protein